MKKILTATMIAATCLFANTAFAVDTNEVLDKGTMEIAPALTLDNLYAGAKPSFGAEIGIGYGLLDELTIGTGFYMGTEESFEGASFGFDIYSVYTPLDSDYFDIDIMMDFDINTVDGYTWTPSVEFNFDFAPDQEFMGLYARVGLPVYYATNDARADVSLDIMLGAYITIAEDHQILLEGGFVVENMATELAVVSNPLSIGYNVALLDNFELTTELAFYIPSIGSEEDAFGAALSIGGLFGFGGSSEDSSEAASE
ncbi:MAG: hypothetical protein J6S69_05440 [Proteobacteria bacterium]|nr:hypothetical protein [Pseudomonadota bacterium]